MAFEINALQTQPQPHGATDARRMAAARTEQTPTQQETGRATTSETVSITETAAKLQKLSSTVEKLPVIDTQRVDAIKRAIDEGTYQVNPARIAKKMLGFEQQMA